MRTIQVYAGRFAQCQRERPYKPSDIFFRDGAPSGMGYCSENMRISLKA